MKAPGKARPGGAGARFWGPRSRLQAAGTRSDHVQSLVRALGIINQLAAADEGMTLTRISECVGLPPSTAHRLLTTLEQERYVHFDHERRLWSVGVQAFMTGAVFLRTRDLVGIARPYMRARTNDSTETVNFAIEDENEAIYLAQVECRQMMRALARPGRARASLLLERRQGASLRDARRRPRRGASAPGHAAADGKDHRQQNGAARRTRPDARARLRHRRRRARLWASLRRRAGVRRIR